MPRPQVLGGERAVVGGPGRPPTQEVVRDPPAAADGMVHVGDGHEVRPAALIASIQLDATPSARNNRRAATSRPGTCRTTNHDQHPFHTAGDVFFFFFFLWWSLVQRIASFPGLRARRDDLGTHRPTRQYTGHLRRQ